MLNPFISNGKNDYFKPGMKLQSVRYFMQWFVLILLFWGLVPGGAAMAKSSDKSQKKTPANSQKQTIFKTSSSQSNSKSTKAKKKSCGSLAWISGRELTPATVGVHYSFRFQVSGGKPPVYFSSNANQFVVPGLFMSANGLIAGTPTQQGKYVFPVFACDSCPGGGRCFEKEFILRVRKKKPAIRIKVNPTAFNLAPKGINKRKIVYTFENSTGSSQAGHVAGKIRFDSWTGIFTIRGKPVGKIKTHLKAEGRHVFMVSENITVPHSVIKKAGDMNAGQLVYTRIFDSKDPQVSKKTKILLTIIKTDLRQGKPARYTKTEFRVKQVRLYFENKGTRIRIEKKQPLPRLIAQIEYTGSGTLAGYWNTGSQTIAVNRKIGPGQSVQIVFPTTIKHLTEQNGTYRIGFVINSPEKSPSSNRVEYRVIPGSAARFVKRQIVVSTQPDDNRKRIRYLERKYGLKVLETFKLHALNRRVTVFSTKKNIFSLIREIKKEKGVLSAQPNTIFTTAAEPHSDLQGISKRLNFKKLHKVKRGKGVKVAILDTGVDIKHRDFNKKQMVYKNLVGKGGYRPEIHGTAVAGIIAARINNYGIEGIAPDSEILAIRTCAQVSSKYPEGQGNTLSVVKGIDMSIQKKARIVNMSFGAPVVDPLIQSMLREGGRRGVLFVAPVGNLAGQKKPNFPASSPDVLAVGGTTVRNKPYPDRHLASQAKVCAPAVNVFTTIPRNRHNFMTGTSMSSAIVTGILALAMENRKSLRLKHLPGFKGHICRWTEKVLKLSLCD